MVYGNRKLRTLASMVPGTHLLKLLFLTRYINCLSWFSARLLASPRGEVASRSDDGEGTVSVAIDISRCNEKFSSESLAELYI